MKKSLLLLSLAVAAAGAISATLGWGGSPSPFEPLTCDLDGNGKVDRNDIALIVSHIGSRVPPADPKWDVNGDGVVSINDARFCALRCTNTNCAP